VGADGAVLTVRLPGSTPVRMGDAISLAISPNHLHIFDAAGGQRL